MNRDYYEFDDDEEEYLYKGCGEDWGAFLIRSGFGITDTEIGNNKELYPEEPIESDPTAGLDFLHRYTTASRSGVRNEAGFFFAQNIWTSLEESKYQKIKKFYDSQKRQQSVAEKYLRNLASRWH